MATLRYLAPAAALLLLCTAARAGETIDYPGLGSVAVERPAGTPTRFIIFLSGDGGWNQGVVGMARHLADDGALVAGVDTTRMARLASGGQASCVNAAASLEGLSHYLQQQRGLRQYLVPILVGYSSGATLAYGTLVQAPPGTFAGAVSLGFCPDLEWSKPLCRGEGLEHESTGRSFVYHPATRLRSPWIALQGEIDQVCAASATRDFVARVAGAELVALPLVGHGFSVERNWLPQLTDAVRRIAAEVADPPDPLPADVGDLPLVEMPAQGARRDQLAIMLSGDGGWAGLDREVAAQLNERGYPVVGWNSLRYFWDARTPEASARDLDRVIRHYTHAWGASSVLLVGYSQGADVLPFMVNRLPESTRRLVAGTALIAVGTEAFFEFSVTHWIGTPTGGRPVMPELEHGRPGRLACIYGSDEDSPCRTLRGEDVLRIELPGGHHFDGDYRRVSDAVLEALPRSRLDASGKP